MSEKTIFLRKFRQVVFYVDSQKIIAYFERVRNVILPERGMTWIDDGHSIATTIKNETLIAFTIAGSEQNENLDFLKYENVMNYLIGENKT
jgi:hypothetical protein